MPLILFIEIYTEISGDKVKTRRHTERSVFEKLIENCMTIASSCVAFLTQFLSFYAYARSNGK